MNTHDDGLEPSLEPAAPTPQDYGLPDNPKAEQLQVWFRQQAFLEAYAKCGKVGKAAHAVGLTRWCVDKWLHNDVYAIKKRMAEAHQDYVELLEEDMDDAISGDPKGRYAMPAAVQRIFRLKAEHPGKYREEVKVIGTEAPLRMLEMMRELGKKELEQLEEQKALESPAIEGEYREVPARMPDPGVKAPPQSGSMSPPRTDPEPAFGAPGPQPQWSAKERRAAQVRAARGARGRSARPVNRR